MPETEKIYVWSKLSPSARENAWADRLAFMSERVSFSTTPGARTVRIEAYSLSPAEAVLLKALYGGSIGRLNEKATKQQPIRIEIRRKLLITSGSIAPVEDFAEQRISISIPSGMAFGTGEHATTAGCLCLLCDASKTAMVGWELLDVGTGTGILAIAGEKLGAAACLALDYDPTAIRIARENAILNRCERIAFQKADITRWRPHRQWNVITANLYDSMLIASAKVLARACGAGGQLIFSGILRGQEQACLRALRPFFLVKRVQPRGKWLIGAATRR